jgi:hypothetical protein
VVVGEGEGQGAVQLEGPADDDRVPPSIADLVVNPEQGWWHRTSGPQLGGLAVGHRPQQGLQAKVVTAHFQPLVDAGLVSDDAEPWFARVVHRFEIAVGTPPQVISLAPRDQ